jgi:predicted membrane-bound dolichyl-phosphate-mannose-protein mannosyltransferase
VINIKNNLLLGNGVNQNSNSDELNSFKIKKRFLGFLDQNMQITEHEVIKNAYNKHKNEITKSGEDNIEVFSNFIFHKLKKDFDIYNNKYRLRDILKENAIKSIFIKDSKFINIEIDKSIKDQILEYDNIFTLNYYAYWDEKNICDYLHGQVKFIDGEIANIKDLAFNPNLKVPKSEAKLIYPSKKIYPRYDLEPGKKV